MKLNVLAEFIANRINEKSAVKPTSNEVVPTITGEMIAGRLLLEAEKALYRNSIVDYQSKIDQWVLRTKLKTKWKPLTLAQWHAGYKAKLGLQRERSILCP
jgi:hypothetical protein